MDTRLKRDFSVLDCTICRAFGVLKYQGIGLLNGAFVTAAILSLALGS